LAIGLWSGRANTLSLLGDKAELAISAAIGQIEKHLDPAEDQVRFIAELVAKGALEVADQGRFSDVLTAALAAAPQVMALVFIDAQHQLLGVERTDDGVRVYHADYSGDATVRGAVARAREAETLEWGPPAWRPRFELTILNLRQPLRRQGAYLGVLVAVVSVAELSDYLAGLSTLIGSNAFILYDRDRVLAHAQLIGRYPGLSVAAPLPELESFGDPVLAAMWREGAARELEIDLGKDIDGRLVEVFGERYVFLHREFTRYGERPWQVGSYFRAADLGEELRRLVWAAAGILALLLSTLAAVLLAHHIARPITRLAGAASRIGRLEISEVSELPPSRFRELDEQATAFNTMLRALRWFETYVPRTLVRRLVQRGGAAQVDSVERELTVMFTDIAGFTSLSEGRPAEQVAAFLNEHFALIAAEVEAEGGTVDKFIGDSVMAFWGAPEAQADHALRACRAVRAIAAAQAAANQRRRARGEPPVGLRIGLHSGPVTVGNIGAPGRMNYTIVGDTVNVAQRLEQLGKRVHDDAPEVVVLISDETVSHLPSRDGLEAAGAFEVPGREQPVEVFKLV
ncbi:MAG: adenylate/guanylate cyclase domain-containing protein, partial [Alphaproteobacteria bacterium]|nr:adenylate/guanylate cyclase domain-containing protein [Alphaproteobacteria bacterium]